ncbi:hypothetical protein P9112_003426 [Eukaryota sp. TZLM1-RC]
MDPLRLTRSSSSSNNSSPEQYHTPLQDDDGSVTRSTKRHQSLFKSSLHLMDSLSRVSPLSIYTKAIPLSTRHKLRTFRNNVTTRVQESSSKIGPPLFKASSAALILGLPLAIALRKEQVASGMMNGFR